MSEDNFCTFCTSGNYYGETFCGRSFSALFAGPTFFSLLPLVWILMRMIRRMLGLATSLALP